MSSTYLNLFKFYLSIHNSEIQASPIGLIAVSLCLVQDFPTRKLSVSLSGHSPFKHLNGDLLFEPIRFQWCYRLLKLANHVISLGKQLFCRVLGKIGKNLSDAQKIILIDFREVLKASQTLSLDAHALIYHGCNKLPVEGNPLEFPIQTQATDTLA